MAITHMSAKWLCMEQIINGGILTTIIFPLNIACDNYFHRCATFSIAFAAAFFLRRASNNLRTISLLITIRSFEEVNSVKRFFPQ